jgi:hypothetical protein
MITLEKLTQLNESKVYSDNHYKYLNEPINQIGDDYWFLEYSNNQYNVNSNILNWKDTYKGIPNELIVVAQEYSLTILNGYTNPTTGRMIIKNRGRYEKLLAPSHLFRAFLIVYPDYKCWNKLSFEEIRSVVINELDKIRKRFADTGKLKKSTGNGLIEKLLNILRMFNSHARNANPFSEYALNHLPSKKTLVKDYLEKQKITYEEFNKPEHHQYVPFHIALPWLAYIMEEFNTEKLSYWRLYWLFAREINDLVKRKRFPHHHSITEHINAIQKVCDGTYYFNSGSRKKVADSLLKAYQKHSLFIFDKVIKPTDFLEYINIELAKRPPDSKDKTYRRHIYTNYLRHLYAAIAITNGPRRCEIINLKLCDFDEVTDETSNYKSFIHKTNDGLPTIRNIAGFVHEIADKSCDLGYKNRKDPEVLLFSTQNNLNSDHKFDASNKSEYISNSYQIFLNSLPEELAQEFIEECPRVTSHQARHLFAAFAIRVCDGNVFEAIRKHFRHVLSSFMTNEYTEYKLTPEEQGFVEREYIREIITRIGNKENHGFFGPMLFRLERLIEKKMEFWGADSFGELTNEVDSITDLIDTVKVHEWGLCLPVTSTITQSKCYDKRTKLPQYDERSSFSACSGCIHLLSNDACIEDIKRIAFSLIQTLDNYPLISGTLRKLYETSLKRAENLIKQNAK